MSWRQKIASAMLVVLALSLPPRARGQDNPWLTNNSGFWDVAANWGLGLPSPGQNAVINFPSITTTLRSGAFSVASVRSQSALDIIGGSLALSSIGASGSTITGHLQMDGGAILGAGSLAISGSFTWTGGSFGGSNSITSSGASTFDGGANTLAIGGSTLYKNTGAVDWASGALTIGASAQLQNLASGTLNIGWDGSVAGGLLNNAGYISKDGSAGTAVIGSTLTNGGTIEVLQGNLTIQNANLMTNSGSIKANGANSSVTLSGAATSATALGSLITLNGGTIYLNVAQLNLNGGSFDATAYGNLLLAGTAIVGGGDVTHSSQLKFKQGATNILQTVTGDSGFNFTTPGTIVARGITPGGSMTIGTNTTFQNEASFGQPVGGATYTNNGLLENLVGANHIDCTFSDHFINNGSVLVDNSTLIIDGGNSTTIANSGSIHIQNGGVFGIFSNSTGSRPAWSNAGAIVVDGSSSQIQLGGSFTLAGLGSFQLTNGGNVQMQGVMDLGGGSLDLGTYGSSRWTVYNNGTIQNGSIRNSDLLLFRPVSSQAVLDNVSVDHGFTLNSGATVGIHDSFQSGGRILVENGSRLDFYTNGYSINNEIQYAGTSNLSNAVGNITINVGANGWLHGTGVSLVAFSTGGTWIDNGQISADGSSGTFAIQAKTFTNNGVLAARDGATMDLTGSTTFTNFGTQTLSGGTYDVDANSTIKLNNADIVTNNATIELNGVGSRIIDQNGNDGLRNFSSNLGTLDLEGGRTLTRSAAISNSGSLVIGAGSTLTTPTLNITGGALTGDGSVQASVVNGGLVAPGPGVGHLSVSGSYLQSSTGSLAIDISGAAPGSFDSLSIIGNATLGGNLNVNLIGGFQPTAGSTFTILNASSAAGRFATLIGSSDWRLIYGPENVYLQWRQQPILITPNPIGGPPAVPEAPSLRVLLIALGALACHRRRGFCRVR